MRQRNEGCNGWWTAVNQYRGIKWLAEAAYKRKDECLDSKAMTLAKKEVEALVKARLMGYKKAPIPYGYGPRKWKDGTWRATIEMENIRGIVLQYDSEYDKVIHRIEDELMDCGIAHLDLGPANIIRTRKNVYRVVDWDSRFVHFEGDD